MTNDKESIARFVLDFSIRTIFNIVLVMALVEGLVYSYHFSYKLFADIPYKPTNKIMYNVEIAKGDTASVVAKQLATTGVVETEYIFLARAYLGKYNTCIKPGNYKLGPGMTPDEICKEICGLRSEGES